MRCPICFNCLAVVRQWGEQGIATIPPMWMLNHVPNMMACHVSILHNAQGPNNTITQSDVAGLLALGEAYRILLRDRALCDQRIGLEFFLIFLNEIPEADTADFLLTFNQNLDVNGEFAAHLV